MNLHIMMFHALYWHHQRCTDQLKIKNDKMDAFNIATNLMRGSYKAVHVPTDHDN